jgi:hypothetical protein
VSSFRQAGVVDGEIAGQALGYEPLLAVVREQRSEVIGVVEKGLIGKYEKLLLLIY